MYSAVVNDGTKYHHYVGISAPPLRIRIANHFNSLRTNNHQTSLSKLCKQIEDSGSNFTLKFKLIENKPAYTPESRICQLCNSEKYHIIFSKLENLVNLKNEITGKCRHRARFKLNNV